MLNLKAGTKPQIKNEPHHPSLNTSSSSTLSSPFSKILGKPNHHQNQLQQHQQPISINPLLQSQFNAASISPNTLSSLLLSQAGVNGAANNPLYAYLTALATSQQQQQQQQQQQHQPANFSTLFASHFKTGFPATNASTPAHQHSTDHTVLPQLLGLKHEPSSSSSIVSPPNSVKSTAASSNKYACTFLKQFLEK